MYCICILKKCTLFDIADLVSDALFGFTFLGFSLWCRRPYIMGVFWAGHLFPCI